MEELKELPCGIQFPQYMYTEHLLCVQHGTKTEDPDFNKTCPVLQRANGATWRNNYCTLRGMKDVLGKHRGGYYLSLGRMSNGFLVDMIL